MWMMWMMMMMMRRTRMRMRTTTTTTMINIYCIGVQALTTGFFHQQRCGHNLGTRDIPTKIVSLIVVGNLTFGTGMVPHADAFFKFQGIFLPSNLNSFVSRKSNCFHPFFFWNEGTKYKQPRKS
jgi:hypothetical protein